MAQITPTQLAYLHRLLDNDPPDGPHPDTGYRCTGRRGVHVVSGPTFTRNEWVFGTCDGCQQPLFSAPNDRRWAAHHTIVIYEEPW